MIKIFADAGHGGKDSGGIGNGLKEKDIVLKMVKYFKKYLESNYQNVEVGTSRLTDKFYELSERAKMANNFKADLFISFHTNAGGGTGYETFVHPNAGSPTSNMRKIIHNEMGKAINKFKGFKDRGTKVANYVVLRETKMPAVLTETLFIDRKEDASYLKNDQFLKDVAEGHAVAVAKIFNLKKKSNIIDYPIKKGDTLYSISRDFNTTVNSIYKLNKHIKNVNKIQAGDVIKIERG